MRGRQSDAPTKDGLSKPLLGLSAHAKSGAREDPAGTHIAVALADDGHGFASNRNASGISLIGIHDRVRAIWCTHAPAQWRIWDAVVGTGMPYK